MTRMLAVLLVHDHAARLVSQMTEASVSAKSNIKQDLHCPEIELKLLREDCVTKFDVDKWCSGVLSFRKLAKQANLA